MQPSITTIISSLSKFIYLLPFLNYFMINKRKKEFELKNNHELIKIGIIIAGVGIGIVFLINVLGFLNIVRSDNVNFDVVYLIQIITNILIIIGYSLLFKALLELYEQKIGFTEIALITGFLLLMGAVMVTSTTNNLLRLTLISYVTQMYLLSNSFILTGLILKRIGVKTYYLAIMSSLVLLLDPLIFYDMYLRYFTDLTQPAMFYSLRNIMYLVSGIAMGLVNIPNLSFMIKLRKRETISYNDKDSLVENTMKRLINELQRIYGTVTLTLFKGTCDSFYQDFQKKSRVHQRLKFQEHKLQ